MIFYFSGTGNSEWVAKQLAHLTDDTAYEITTLSEVLDVQAAKQIGFVFPVYAWGAPECVKNFAKSLPQTKGFTFGVCTCGQDAGMTMKYFSKIYPLHSSYSLVMPNNYIIGSDTDDEKVIHAKIAIARKEIQKIAHEIVQQENVYRVQEGSMARLKSKIANFGFNKFARSTKSFYVTNACNECGLCAKNCPASTITLKKGKPEWDKQCFQCLRCINECPRQAIQYGKSTEDRSRYSIWQYLEKDSY